MSTANKNVTDVNSSTGSQSVPQLGNQNNEIKPIASPVTRTSLSFSQTPLKTQMDVSVKKQSEVAGKGFNAIAEQKSGELPKRTSAANLLESQVRE